MNFDSFCIIGLARWLATVNFGFGSPWYYVIFGLSVLVCIVAPYFLGGLNFAIIISKKKFGVDIRDYGSGNAGMTNMRRTFGKKMGLLTLAGDAGKAIVSCLIGYLLIGLLGAYIAGLFCIIGHMFPVMYKFKGGKGIACTAAVILMTDLGHFFFKHIPILFLIILACFFVIVLASKYVSLGSVMCMLVYPLFLGGYENAYISLINVSDEEMTELLRDPMFSTYITDHWLYIVIAVIMTVLVVFMHRENIKRLLHGEESRFELRTKGKKTLYEESKKNDER